ncbi:MAG: hypothetical protein JSU04_20245 [Bdellovibrionales bacterium]|nr:hypothetical protein [Bdellovibrionales bacterium]
MFIPILLICFQAHAQVRSNLYTKPEVKVVPNIEEAKNKKKKISQSAQYNSFAGRGNLDAEILVASSSYRSEDSQIVLPSTAKGIHLKGLRIGDVVNAEIPESLFAFPDSKAPVRAKIKSGELRGSIFLGEASLEKNSKRILIEFKKFHPGFGFDDYQVSASVLDPKGILGLEGQYVNQESKFFAAEFFTSAAAGFADASIERGQNVFGNYVDAPTVDTASKKALSSAMSKTAEKFSEKIKASPEYSVLEGPVEIKILITEQPKIVE